MPKVGEAAGCGAGRDLKHQGAGFLEIGKRHDVRSRRVGRQKSKLVLKGQVIDVVGLANIKLREMLVLPLLHSHQRQCPKVSLTGSLVVYVVENFFDRGSRGVAIFQFKFSEPSFDPAGGWQILSRSLGGSKNQQDRRRDASDSENVFHGW